VRTGGMGRILSRNDGDVQRAVLRRGRGRDEEDDRPDTPHA
jgi:hypothetical protein